MAVEIETMEGVEFVNPRAVWLSGKRVSGSQFYNSEVKSYPQFIGVRLDAEVNGSTFINLNRVKIATKSNFTDNRFVNIRHAEINSELSFADIQFQNSLVNIYLDSLEEFTCVTCRFDSSVVELHNKLDARLFFTKQSYFTQNSRLRIMKSVSQLSFDNVFIFNVSFDFSNVNISHSLSLNDTIVSGFLPKESLFTLKTLQNVYQPLKILLTSSTLIGFYKSIVTSIPNDSPIQFNVQIFNSSLNIRNQNETSQIFSFFQDLQKNSSNFISQRQSGENPSSPIQFQPLIDLQKAKIEVNQHGIQEFLVRVEDYNLRNSILRRDHDQLIERGYFASEYPAYYSIKDVKFVETEQNYTISLITDQKEYYINNTSSLIQTFSSKIHRIRLKSPAGESLNIKAFEFEVWQDHETMNKNYTVKIEIPSRAIKTVNVQLQGNEGISNVSFSKAQDRNGLEISWKTTTGGGKQHFKVSLVLCEKDQLFSKEQCVNRCICLTQDLTCVNKCDEHFFIKQDLNASPMCEQCPLGCALCQNKTACTQCHAALISVGGSCFDTCDLGEFKNNGSCHKCMPGCLKCDNTLTCESCSEKNKNNICKNCLTRQYISNGKCQQCHPTCSECLGGSPYECTKCSPSHHSWGHLCIPS